MKNIDPNRTYRREGVDKIFKEVKKVKHAEALVRGGGVALSTDYLTGKPLRGGESYDYDHVVSCEEVFSRYKLTHTNEEIAQIVNVLENVLPTHRDINKSMGKKSLRDFLTVDNIQRFGIDVSLAENALSVADAAIRRKVNELL